MTAVFADTFYWYGLSNPRDQWHHVVLRARTDVGRRPIVTTDEVLVEYASSMASDLFLRVAARSLIDAIMADPNVTVLPQSRDSFVEGLDLFSSRPD